MQHLRHKQGKQGPVVNFELVAESLVWHPGKIIGWESWGGDWRWCRHRNINLLGMKIENWWVLAFFWPNCRQLLRILHQNCIIISKNLDSDHQFQRLTVSNQLISELKLKKKFLSHKPCGQPCQMNSCLKIYPIEWI